MPQAQSRTEPPLRPTPVPDAAFGHALLLPLAILIGIALRYLLGLSVAGVALFTGPGLRVRKRAGRWYPK